ncbi:uncharacterized protein [Dipodomys merriami]|uniref:uncharacterized protein n=1 Tax=Dipodomys merriami TaxID=94247 RepID=UPI003855820D
MLKVERASTDFPPHFHLQAGGKLPSGSCSHQDFILQESIQNKAYRISRFYHGALAHPATENLHSTNLYWGLVAHKGWNWKHEDVKCEAKTSLLTSVKTEPFRHKTLETARSHLKRSISWAPVAQACNPRRWRSEGHGSKLAWAGKFARPFNSHSQRDPREPHLNSTQHPLWKESTAVFPLNTIIPVVVNYSIKNSLVYAARLLELMSFLLKGRVREGCVCICIWNMGEWTRK